MYIGFGPFGLLVLTRTGLPTTGTGSVGVGLKRVTVYCELCTLFEKGERPIKVVGKRFGLGMIF